ncbi:MAG: phosphate signaling complex protein PhoU [Chloroflexi bacterium]|nr:phosphate signaling complex protein PhoU [Chloroflexota bacterium]
MTPRTRATFDHSLQAVQDDLLRLGSMLDAAVSRAIQALANSDSALARHVVVDDGNINALRFKIEEACLRLIATQQPAARDLRTIVAAFSIVSDMERMADHAAGIAKTVIRMGNEPLVIPLDEIPHMAEECRAMLHTALDAYIRHDVDLARTLPKRDDVVDALYERLFHTVVTTIAETPGASTRALYLLFAAHNLERIGDRAVNIAERVIFITSGEMKELNAGPDAPL